MTAVILSVIIIFIGPILFLFIKRENWLFDFIDGFNIIAITGLVILNILPELSKQYNLIVLPVALSGFLLPSIIEHYFVPVGKKAHLFTLCLGILGLLFHAFIDGAALISDDQNSLLPWAVIIHKLPVGLTLWLLLIDHLKKAKTFLFVSLLAVMTCLGFIAGSNVLLIAGNSFTILFQAFVTGSLLHVVFHQGHHHDHKHSKQYFTILRLTGAGVASIGLSYLFFRGLLLPH